MRFFIKLLIVFFLIFNLQIFAESSNTGTTTANFLMIGAGANALSLGGAYTSLSDNVEGLYWNPGAIAKAERSQAEFYSANWLVGTKYSWIGLLLKVTPADAIGLSFTNLNYGEEDVNSVTEPYGTGEKWSASDIAFGVSYGRSLTDRFSIGGTFKYINQRIWHSSSSGFAFDVGLLFITQFNDMRISMSIANFGSDMFFDGKDLYKTIDIDPNHTGNNEAIVSKLKVDKWPIPLVFRTGILVNLYKDKFSDIDLLVDAVRPNNNTEYINMGLKYNFKQFIHLNVGYSSLFKKDAQEGLTFGFGLNYSIAGLGIIEAQYGVQTMDLFDNIHSFSISFKF